MSSTAPAATADPIPLASADWRIAVPEERRRHLRTWLLTGAALTFLILVIGGITRLTQSGLSIVDWQPVLGVLPPLNEAQWQEAFERYRQFPEYQQLRRGMSLTEFKFIYFWEYLHRMVARGIGLVFLLPFAVFWVRGYFTPALLRRVLLLFALGALQGFVGWFMVRSGLVDRPHVSHFRLAIHLSIAFAIFGLCLWYAADLRTPLSREPVARSVRQLIVRGLSLLGALLVLQIFYGALVAGLKAGLFFNTFPRMGGSWIPPNVLGLDPPLLNLVENPVTVQWVHRVLGTVLGFAAVAFFLRVRSAGVDGTSRTLNNALLSLVVVQYLLGVLTLLYHVPVGLGVAHQAMAMLLFGVWLSWLHHARRLRVH